MGFFSWSCSACKKPILAPYFNQEYEKYSEVVLLTPHRAPFKGTYDGYGRISGKDVHCLAANLKENDDNRSKAIDMHFDRDNPMPIKLVHEHCYTDQTHDSVDGSNRDENQGYFYGAKDLEEIYGH